jgi:hypothetical protein
MYRKNRLKLWVAGMLASLLLLGVMPKPVVHEWITGHEHTVAAGSEHTEVETAGSQLSCECQMACFTSPYIASQSFETGKVLVYPSALSVYIPENLPHTQRGLQALRGPPASL